MTTRIRSQFDVEMQLGRGWLFRALAILAAEGLLFTPPPPFPPDAEVSVVDVEIIFEPAEWDRGGDRAGPHRRPVSTARRASGLSSSATTSAIRYTVTPNPAISSAAAATTGKSRWETAPISSWASPG